MKRKVLLSLAFVAVLSSFSSAQFTSGNLAVSRMGDGSAALTSAGTAAFVDQFTTIGGFVNSLALPTTNSGANKGMVNSGTATSEGFLTLSTNGLFLTMMGYNAAVGTAAVAGTTSAVANRVVARIDGGANVDSTTALTDAYSTGNPRSVVWDGSSFFMGGTGASGAGGARSTSLGGTTSTLLSGALNNVRVVNLFGGSLYASASSGSNIGVSLVSGGAATLLPGFAAITGQSPYDFFFANSTTLYVADDSAANGGIGKWTFDGTNWVRQYILGTGVTGVGARGLTGVTIAGGPTTLYATTSEGTLNRLISITDTGSGSVASTLSTAGTNMIYRGVDFTPVPEPGVLMAFGLGIAGIAALRRRKK